jgi:hypothetical protein
MMNGTGFAGTGVCDACSLPQGTLLCNLSIDSAVLGMCHGKNFAQPILAAYESSIAGQRGSQWTARR